MTPAPKWPRMPAEVYSLIGPYSVTVGPIAEVGVFGEVNHHTRAVTIREGLPPNTMVHTLMHEIVHMALHESGAEEVMSHEQQELVCTAVGLWLTGAIGAGWLTVKR
jgi:hypothetical protein